jgi:hypothetical protein
MKLSEKGGGDFAPHPETDAPVRAVIVDVTPLVKQQSQFGEREVFKLVFESELEREDGSRFCVWSRPYTPSLNEKANFRKDLKKLLGRDLTASERAEFDTEDLLGLPLSIMIEHTEGDNGQTYANLSMVRPYKGDDPLEPCGKYVRKKDREGGGGQAQGQAAAYRSTAGDGEGERDDWQKTKVHVGKHAGVELGELDAEAVQKLLENWLPQARLLEKPKADDRRLMVALDRAQEALASVLGGEDDIQF